MKRRFVTHKSWSLAWGFFCRRFIITQFSLSWDLQQSIAIFCTVVVCRTDWHAGCCLAWLSVSFTFWSSFTRITSNSSRTFDSAGYFQVYLWRFSVATYVCNAFTKKEQIARCQYRSHKKRRANGSPQDTSSWENSEFYWILMQKTHWKWQTEEIGLKSISDHFCDTFMHAYSKMTKYSGGSEKICSSKQRDLNMYNCNNNNKAKNSAYALCMLIHALKKEVNASSEKT